MSKVTEPDQPQQLKRSLTLWLAVLYGLGVTIGAGIYVLVGIAAGRSGMHAPLAFVFAALVMSLSAAAFAELGTRMPVSASEAAYVEKVFNRPWLSLTMGLLVVLTATISACLNITLIRIKSIETTPPPQVFVCPMWVPVAGLVSSVGLLLLDLVVR